MYSLANNLNAMMLRRRASAAPDPILALFASGEQGIYWRRSKSEFFQLSDCTSPASTNETVGCIQDISGNAHKISQTTEASRALLTSTALLFDGQDDYYIGSYADPGVSHRLAAAVFSYVPDSSRGIVIYGRFGPANLIAIGANSNSDLEVSSHDLISYTSPMPSGTVRILATREVATNDFKVWVNGTAVTLTNDGTALQSSLGAPITIGSRADGAEVFSFNGEIAFNLLHHQNEPYSQAQIDLVNAAMAEITI